MQMQFSILPSFLLLLLSSCNLQPTKIETGFKKMVTDTSISHWPYNEIDFSRAAGSMLNLPQIDEGVDSFELRIWVTGIIAPKTLIISKFDGGKWNSFKYLCYYNDDTGLDSMNVYKLETPKEINRIIAHLQEEEILELPSQIAIPNFFDGIRDGQTCTIEIATKDFYKALQYHCPENFSKEPNNIKFMNLVEFLNPYYKFYTPWCKPGK